MKKCDKFFEGYNVPEKLKNITITIMRRFTIRGLCDGMYICNIIAHTCGIGDGKGNFTSDEISGFEKIADRLQKSYGCNIYKEDLQELENTLVTGKLDKERAIAGINKHIRKCKEEKQICDQWRVDYLNECINEAKENLREIKS